MYYFSFEETDKSIYIIVQFLSIKHILVYVLENTYITTYVLLNSSRDAEYFKIQMYIIILS